MYGRSKRGACGYMFSRILGVALLAVVAQGRAATIKGTIVLNEVGGQPIFQRQVKGLDAMQPATAITMDKLQQERDQAKAYAQKASEGLARRGSASVHHCAGKSAVVFGWTNRRRY
jgi:hypothetical protein